MGKAGVPTIQRRAAERWWARRKSAPLPTLQFPIRGDDQSSSRRAREAEVPNPEGAEGSPRHLALCVAQEPDSVPGGRHDRETHRLQGVYRRLLRIHQRRLVFGAHFVPIP